MMTEAFLRSLTMPELLNYLDGRTLNQLETTALLSKSRQIESRVHELEIAEGTVNQLHDEECHSLQEQIDDEETKNGELEKEAEGLQERIEYLESKLTQAGVEYEEVKDVSRNDST